MRKTFLVFIVSFSIMESLARQASQRMRFEHLTVADGLPENSVTCMFQDREGILWIGTYMNGINRLYSKTGKFTHYWHTKNDPNSLGFDHVRVIYEDKKGELCRTARKENEGSLFVILLSIA